MFGILKKKLNDIAKKFSKREEEKIKEIAAEETKKPEEITSLEEPSAETEHAEEEKTEVHEIPATETEEEKTITEEKAEEVEKFEEPVKAISEEHEITAPEKIEKAIEEKLPEEEIIAEEKIEEKIENLGEPVKRISDEQEIIPEEKVEKETPYEEKTEKTKVPEPEAKILAEHKIEQETKEYEKKAYEPELHVDKEEPGIEETFEEKKEPEKLKQEKPKLGFIGRLLGRKEKPPEPTEIPKAEEISKPAEKKEKRKIISRITEKEITREEVQKTAEELKLALLESDVALDVAEHMCKTLEEELTGRVVRRGEAERIINKSLKKSISEILDQGDVKIEYSIENAKKEGRPALIVFLGFNGTGKTTNLAKLAYMLKQKGYKPVLAAGDTFRAASIEQLEIHATNIGADIVKQKYGSDSAAVIFDAREHAKANNLDVVLADTAGRSHSNVNLMDELKKVIRVNKPDVRILVLDALTGNDIVEQAHRFDEAVGVDAIILTKADVYEKGGAALSAAYTIKKPIIFLGTGQDYTDLKKFDPKEIAENLVGA